MLKQNPVTKQNGDCIVVGRGATAIYLVLKYGKIPCGKVIVPANICYAAVFPIIYAEYEPIFCDVDPNNGNVTIDTIKEAYSESIVAAVIPHMYGNPVADLLEIKCFFKDKGIILIEDCASLMTNQGDSYIPGTIGDYVVYSTGYSKTIDIGFGGLLCSTSFSLEEMEKNESTLPIYKHEFEYECNIFSKVYRVLRNNGQDSCIAKGIYKSLTESLKNSFVFSIEESRKKEIINAIQNLDYIIRKRRRNYQLYIQNLEGSRIKDKIFAFGKDSVPWRFNILMRDNARPFIDYCLREMVPVSDWYPCVTPIFGIEQEFKGAMTHEKCIVNFPLLISEEEIDRICVIINSYMEENK